MSKSLLLQVGFGHPFSDMLAVSEPVHRSYCKAHGFDFLSVTENVNPSVPALWQRFNYLKSALAARYKFVALLDADVLIVNQSVDLRSACSTPLGMIYGKSYGPNEPYHYNSGALYVNADSELNKFLKLFLSGVPSDDTMGTTPWWQNPNSDQNRMNQFLKLPEWIHLVSNIDVRWNSIFGYHDMQVGYVLAWHGTPAQERLDRMKVEIANRHLLEVSSD